MAIKPTPKPTKGTQPGHVVTDNNNHTKPVTPAPKPKVTVKAKPKNPAVAFVENERKDLAEMAAKEKADKAAREAEIAATN